MRNKFKLKKKLASIALALVLAAQPLASLPMNVFAGTGKTGVITAPLKADFKELNKGQIVSSKYIVSKSVAFGEGAVLNGRSVQGPGIVYAQEIVGNSMRDVYIIADIKGMLNAAYAAAYAAADAASAASADDAVIAATSADDAVNAVATSAATSAVNAVATAATYAYNASDGQAKTAWNVAEKACKSAKKALEKGIDLESKLKTAYMAYRVAEAVWIQLGNNPTNLDACKERADALQKVIDRLYSDKVGDHEEKPD